MRHLGSYDWNKILNEEVPKTMISLECLYDEKEQERKTLEKSKKK